jgi:hypothetical protein
VSGYAPAPQKASTRSPDGAGTAQAERFEVVPPIDMGVSARADVTWPKSADQLLGGTSST